MLEVSELYQRFGDRVAVDKLSLAVNGGEIVGLVGRNGAGKTTTMRAVMGIYRPLGGSITWPGHPVALSDRLHFGSIRRSAAPTPRCAFLTRSPTPPDSTGSRRRRPGASGWPGCQVDGANR